MVLEDARKTTLLRDAEGQSTEIADAAHISHGTSPRSDAILCSRHARSKLYMKDTNLHRVHELIRTHSHVSSAFL